MPALLVRETPLVDFEVGATQHNSTWLLCFCEISSLTSFSYHIVIGYRSTDVNTTLGCKTTIAFCLDNRYIGEV